MAAKLGTPDVHGLLDSLTDEQLLEWQAISLIDGWANGWTQTGEIIAAFHNQTNRLILQNVDPKKADEASRQMQWKSGYKIATQMTTFKKSKPKRRLMTPEQAEAELKARYGN